MAAVAPDHIVRDLRALFHGELGEQTAKQFKLMARFVFCPRIGGRLNLAEHHINVVRRLVEFGKPVVPRHERGIVVAKPL